MHIPAYTLAYDDDDDGVMMMMMMMTAKLLVLLLQTPGAIIADNGNQGYSRVILIVREPGIFNVGASKGNATNTWGANAGKGVAKQGQHSGDTRSHKVRFQNIRT